MEFWEMKWGLISSKSFSRKILLDLKSNLEAEEIVDRTITKNIDRTATEVIVDLEV